MAACHSRYHTVQWPVAGKQSGEVGSSESVRDRDGFVVNVDTNVRFVKIYKIKIWTC